VVAEAVVAEVAEVAANTRSQIEYLAAGVTRRRIDAVRGRDASYLAPPAQIRTCGFPAYGSHLG
jgi:hypothetical protein